MTGAIRLLICEDDPRVRQTLSRVAGSQSDLEVVAAVERGEDAIDAALEETLDVIVMDVHLPTIDGIEVIRRLRDQGVDTPVLVLSADDRAAVRAQDFDNVSFLSKGSSGAIEVLAAIRGSAESTG
jgi:two-component system OmpR family response regulator